MELTIQEVALRLNMPIETVHRWIRQGKIPMQNSRGGYTIRHEMLERWAYEHKLSVYAAPKTAAGLTPEKVLDGILPAMQRGGVLYELEGDTKEPILQTAVDGIPNLEAADRVLVYEKLLEREHLASTGIGHGIALPHPRTNLGIRLTQPQVTTCFLAQPIAFDAIDHRPVSVLMILLSGSTKQHLSLLSKISYYLRDRTFRDFILSAPSPEKLWDKIGQMESKSN